MLFCLAWQTDIWAYKPPVVAKPWNFAKKFERPLKWVPNGKFEAQIPQVVWVHYQLGGYGLTWPENSLEVLPLACHAYLACSYHLANVEQQGDTQDLQDILQLPELGSVAARLELPTLWVSTCLLGCLLWLWFWMRLIYLMRRRRRRAEARARRLRRLNQQLFRLVNTDELTGLYNRRGFALLAYRACKHAQQAGKPLSVALIDLDKFKQVNDDYGHLTGDAVLRKVANEIRQASDEDMLVGRRGGDELVICMPGRPLADALVSSERIRKWVAAHPLQTIEQTIWVRCSVGVAQWRAGDSWRSLLARADEGLYRAKRQGGNRVKTVHV